MKKAVTNPFKAIMKPKRMERDKESLSDVSKSWQMRKSKSIRKLKSQQKQNNRNPVVAKNSNTKESKLPKKKQANSKTLSAEPKDNTTGDTTVEDRKKSGRKKDSKKVEVKDLKQFFQLVSATKEAKKSKEKPRARDPTRDYLPDKLKVFMRSEEERTCARTRKTLKLNAPNIKKSLPNNNENNGNLFDKNGNPFWTEVMFDQEEAEKDGVEVEGRLTADHVVRYLEGTLTLIHPPALKLSLDNTREADDMKQMDDEYFNEDAIIYHTLQNVINHSERALQRCISHGNNEDGKQRSRSSEPTSKETVASPTSTYEQDKLGRIRFLMDKTENAVYDRHNVYGSVAKHLVKRRNLAKWNEEVSAAQDDYY